jgi:3-methyladenine DNA glycosylase Mpg
VTFAELADADPLRAASRVLGATLTVEDVAVRIVEVEAYGSGPDGPWPDPAAHSFRGPTRATQCCSVLRAASMCIAATECTPASM